MTEHSQSKPPVISLFSGAGGFDLGMCEHFEIRFMTDFELVCIDTLRMNWTKAGMREFDTFQEGLPEWYQDPEPVILQADIRELQTKEILRLARLEIGECAVIYGGPPCQGFSALGKKRDDDPRNELWREMLRIINEARPETFLLENVPRLAKAAGGKLITEMVQSFEAAGYATHWQVHDCHKFGVPQRRKRLLMSGRRRFPVELERFFRMRYGRDFPFA